MNDLGECYAKGEGVPKDLKKAAALWKRAAKYGNSDAANNLEDMMFMS